MRLMFARDSRSVVDHIQKHVFIPAAALYPDENVAPGGRILNGVIQQIDDRLAENQPIDRHDKVCITFDFNRLQFLLSQNFDDRAGFLCEAQKRNVFTLKLDMPSVSTGKRKQALREPRQAVYL